MSSELRSFRHPESEHEGFDLVLSTLAERMKAWDELQSQVAEIRGQRNVLEPTMESIDLDLAAETYPSEIAYAALGALILDARLKRATDTARSFADADILKAENFVHRKVEVNSLDPDSYAIGTSRHYRYNQLKGLSKWHQSRKGRIVKLILDPDSGGYVEFAGAGNRVYSAYPLVDRHSDYKPAFSLKLL